MKRTLMSSKKEVDKKIYDSSDDDKEKPFEEIDDGK